MTKNLHTLKLEQIDTFLELSGWKLDDGWGWLPPSHVGKFIHTLTKIPNWRTGHWERHKAIYLQVLYEEESVKMCIEEEV